MDREELIDALDAEFGGSDPALRAVSRQARDLADSGLFEDVGGYELTVDDVISNLNDAPIDHSLIERWNWWVGSLELAYGGELQQFRVRPDMDDENW